MFQKRKNYVDHCCLISRGLCVGGGRGGVAVVSPPPLSPPPCVYMFSHRALELFFIILSSLDFVLLLSCPRPAKASRLEQQLEQHTVLSQRLGASLPPPQGSEFQIQVQCSSYTPSYSCYRAVPQRHNFMTPLRPKLTRIFVFTCGSP